MFSGGVGSLNCVELVKWRPKRKHAKNHSPTRKVVGITNYDRCMKEYWGITEVDNKTFTPQYYIKKLKKLGYDAVMIFETSKGYHFYIDYHHKNPLKVYHKLVKTKLFDRGHLSLARKRPEEWYGRLILRISPKYYRYDITPVYVNEEKMSDWHREILSLLIMYQSGVLVATD